MDSGTLGCLEREYTLSQINWKRTLTDLDMKRRKSQQRERDRMQIRIIEQIASPTLSFELENFNLYGKLRKTQTEIHNTLPSPETISAEKDYIAFERLRKLQPQQAKYTNFYGSIQNEANKPRTSRSPAGVAVSGVERSVSRAQLRRDSRAGSFVNSIPTPRGSRAGSFVSNVPTSVPILFTNSNTDWSSLKRGQTPRSDGASPHY